MTAGADLPAPPARPTVRAAAARSVDVFIGVDTGPEVVTGSTRMKAGTAQKLVLNTSRPPSWCAWDGSTRTS